MYNNIHSYIYNYFTNINKIGLFDNYINAVYILTMKDSDRINNIHNINNKFILHSNIIIQVNIGYKKCKKKLYIQNSIHDINDAYYHCFIHASKNNYKNIMILEDDFIFDKTLNQTIADEIGIFINNYKYDIYNLGPLVHFALPFTLKHHRCIYMLTAHACIYNINYFKWYIKKYNNSMHCRNDSIWNNINIIKYKYSYPLCYQLFPPTENQQHWINIFFKFSIILFKLDKSYYPGFQIFNYILYIIIIIFIFICGLT
jgi:hypothetical protein